MAQAKIKTIISAAVILSTFASCNEKNTTSTQPIDPSVAMQFDTLKLTKGYKKVNEHNPIMVQRFGADPYAMEYNGRVYVYMTNDVLEYDTNNKVKENTFGLINKISCVSSDDLVNWTDHGAMPIAGKEEGAAKWANFSWAPTACHKTIDGKEQFFLYFANSGNGIGVVTSETPFGPWTDPLGEPIVSRNTPTCSTVTWLFDPAVLVDDNGDGYLYVGGGVPDGKAADPGTARVVKLADNMIKLDGDPVAINPPYLFEDSGINKIGDTYYYSYCSNFNVPQGHIFGNGEICYMTSKNPMGPFVYAGRIFKNPGVFFGQWGNNHHAICKLQDKYYLFYHAQNLRAEMGIDAGGYRNTNVNEVKINPDGSIGEVIGNKSGVKQLKNFNPFNQNEAETMAWMGGIETRYINSSTNLCVTAIDNGDWIGLSQVDFANGASKFSAKVATQTSGAIKICVDSVDGHCLGILPINNTQGAFVDTQINLSETITGVHNLFFVFIGKFEFDSWTFIE